MQIQAGGSGVRSRPVCGAYLPIGHIISPETLISNWSDVKDKPNYKWYNRPSYIGLHPLFIKRELNPLSNMCAHFDCTELHITQTVADFAFDFINDFINNVYNIIDFEFRTYNISKEYRNLLVLSTRIRLNIMTIALLSGEKPSSLALVSAIPHPSPDFKELDGCAGLRYRNPAPMSIPSHGPNFIGPGTYFNINGKRTFCYIDFRGVPLLHDFIVPGPFEDTYLVDCDGGEGLLMRYATYYHHYGEEHKTMIPHYRLSNLHASSTINGVCTTFPSLADCFFKNVFSFSDLHEVIPLPIESVRLLEGYRGLIYVINQIVNGTARYESYSDLIRAIWKNSYTGDEHYMIAHDVYNSSTETTRSFIDNHMKAVVYDRGRRPPTSVA